MLQISLVKGMCTSDLWSVTLGNFIPLPTWVFGRDRGLKSSNGERSLQDQTGMCNKSYSLFKLCWLDCGFVSHLRYELVSHLGVWFAATLAYILMTHFRLLCPPHGPRIVLLSFAADNKTLFLTSSARTDCNHPSSLLLGFYQTASSLMETQCSGSLCVRVVAPNLTQ